MTDLYIEEPDDPQLGGLEQMRAELARLKSQLEHKVQASASDVLDETRMLARRAQHYVNSRLGASALIAICAGVALGLLAAALVAARSARDR